MTDEQLRAWYRSRRASDSAPHPDPEALAALARREGPEDQRLGLLDHVAQCAQCRQEFDLLRAVGGQGLRPSRRFLHGPSWLPLAAGLVLVAGAGALWTVLKPGEGVVRDGAAAVVLLEPSETDPAALPIRFVWHAIAGASRYRFELVGEDGREILTTEIADTVYDLTARPELAAGRYRWWVTARGTAGEATSPARPLIVPAR